MRQYLRATVFDGGVACVELVTLLREAPHERLIDDWDVMAAGAAALRGEAGRGGKAGGGEVSVAASTATLSDRDPAGALFGHGVRSTQAVLVERAVVEPDKPVFTFLYKLGDPLHYRHEEVLVCLLGECGLKLGDERLELHAVVLVDGEDDVLLLRSHVARLRLRLLVLCGSSAPPLPRSTCTRRSKFEHVTKQPATPAISLRGRRGDGHRRTIKVVTGKLSTVGAARKHSA